MAQIEAPAVRRATVLAAESLSKSFVARGRDPVEAIADLSFEVSAGEFFSVVGPSGAGKTTLLKIIAGLMSPSAGGAWVQGRPVKEPIEDLGMVFQNPVLLPWRTALDNVLLPIEMLRRDRNEYRDRALELLELVGLNGFEYRRPRELSGGMQQRVALCRALIHDPAILLMDEPFGALDEFTRQSLNDYLLTLWEASRKTVVFVTHSVAEAVYLSDRIAVLTARPARLAGTVKVELPRPRRPEMRYDPAFVAHVRKVQEFLRPSR
jgi:NitT/TauT family transport system ATP-binding protein